MTQYDVDFGFWWAGGGPFVLMSYGGLRLGFALFFLDLICRCSRSKTWVSGSCRDSSRAHSSWKFVSCHLVSLLRSTQLGTAIRCFLFVLYLSGQDWGLGASIGPSGKIRYRESKLLKGSESALPPFERLREHLVFEHLAQTMDRSKVYSCPANMLALTNLTDYLDEPATKRQRAGGADCTMLRPDMDLLPESRDLESDTPVFFQLVHPHLGRKKRVHVDVGAGGRVQEGALLVSLHNRLTGFGDEVVLSSRAATSTATSGPGYIFEGFANASFADIQVIFPKGVCNGGGGGVH